MLTLIHENITMSIVYSADLVRVGVIAGERAIRLNSAWIEPEHLLLGLSSWRARGSSGSKLLQGIGVDFRSVRKALYRKPRRRQLAPKNYRGVLPNDWLGRGTINHKTRRWCGSWGPKNWYFEQLKKIEEKTVVSARKTRTENWGGWAKSGLLATAPPQRWLKQSFWSRLFLGVQPPVYDRLSERSKEVLRVAQKETFRYQRGVEVLKVGTLGLVLALSMVEEGATVVVFERLLWESLAFTRKDFHLWFSDPFSRLRINNYIIRTRRRKVLTGLDFASVARGCYFISRFHGIGPKLVDWSKESRSFCRSYGYYLDMCGDNLSEKFLQGYFDGCSGRDYEIRSGLVVLNRRFKNNPVYVGYPGVGKTALVEGMASLIVSRLVPKKMIGKVIISVELMKLVAGTHYRGEFETKAYGVISEVAANDKLVMFIDEVHCICGAGEAEGTVDISTLLKPYMSRGKVSVIGATTYKEYEQSIQRDKALDRRFKQIEVGEPGRVETMILILELSVLYETYHGVIYWFDVLESSVGFAIKYLTARRLPDKALDLFDESGATQSVAIPVSVWFEDMERLEKQNVRVKSRFVEYADQIDTVIRGSNEAIIDNLALARNDFLIPAQSAGVLTGLVRERYGDTYGGNPERFRLNFVNKSTLRRIVAQWTGVPLRKGRSMLGKIEGVELSLCARVIGQMTAISSLVRAIRRAQAEIKVSPRPIACLMFCGPTGVGKTEVCKALAYHWFGAETSLLRIDMAEYSDKESSSKLIGVPPGFVGYGRPGLLTGAMRANSRRVVLFDEVEKAIYEVRCLLLQIMEEATITDGSAWVCNFRFSFVIMTSNAGSWEILEGRDGDRGGLPAKRGIPLTDRILKALRVEFQPEFLNRLDEIVVFNPISPENVKVIIGVVYKQVQERLGVLRVYSTLTAYARKLLNGVGYSSTMGARPVKRMFSEVFDLVMAYCCVVELYGGRTNAHLFLDVGILLWKKQEQTKYNYNAPSDHMSDYGGYRVIRSVG